MLFLSFWCQLFKINKTLCKLVKLTVVFSSFFFKLSKPAFDWLPHYCSLPPDWLEKWREFDAECERHLHQAHTWQKVQPNSRQLQGQTGPVAQPTGIVIGSGEDGQQGGGEH